MASLDRSAALRRLGITEWLPRQDGAAIVSATSGSQPGEAYASPAVRTTLAAATAAAPVAHESVAECLAAPATASQSALPPSVPVQPAAAAMTASAVSVPRISVPTTPEFAIVPATSAVPSSLRGRLLSGPTNAPLLVLAMAEKSPRDTLLNVDSAAGALLQAMLGELAVSSTIALLGVGGGEPIAVPDTIFVLGERSARLLLGNDIAPPLRGRVHLFGQARVVVSYHPDELRQNGSLKRLAWDDLRLLAGLLAKATATATATSAATASNELR